MALPTREESEGKVVIIEIPGRLTLESSGELKDLLKELMEEKKYCIIMDLEQTTYVDSSGLGAIVSKIAMTRSNGGDVRLAHVAPNIQELLELTHLNQILQVCETTEIAVASFDN
jgi:anti-sigma B factor antagonist